MRPDYKIEQTKIHLYNSCFTRKREFDYVLQDLFDDYSENEVLKSRTRKDLKYQWAVFNYRYKKNRIKEKGIDFKPIRKIKKLYYIIYGYLVWPYIN